MRPVKLCCAFGMVPGFAALEPQICGENNLLSELVTSNQGLYVCYGMGVVLLSSWTTRCGHKMRQHFGSAGD